MSEDKSPLPEDDASPKSSGLNMMSVGLEVTAILVVFTLGGLWLDRKIGTYPWLLLVGLTMGMIGGSYSFWLKFKRL